MADFFSTVKLKAKSANTLKSYKGKETRFLNWLSLEEPSCWDEGVPEVIIERNTSGMICSFISEESQWPDRSMKKFGTAKQSYSNSSLLLLCGNFIHFSLDFGKPAIRFSRCLSTLYLLWVSSNSLIH